jgi:hypothetical protein
MDRHILKRKLNWLHLGIFALAALQAFKHGIDWMSLVAISFACEGLKWARPIVSKHFGGSNECAVQVADRKGKPIPAVVKASGNLGVANGAAPARRKPVPVKNKGNGSEKPKSRSK